MKLVNLRVNQIKEPMGFQITPISFSWIVIESGEAKLQKWARVTVYADDLCVFDSGEDQDANSLDYQIPLALLPRTSYRWTVEVCGDNAETAIAVSWFETGKADEAWLGKWISTKSKEHSSVVLAKELTLNQTVQKARIYFCGLGAYELYLNHQKVGDEYLSPGYHSYDFHLQVQTYDVTQMLLEGHNEWSIWLGDGWFKGRFGFDGGYTNIYGDRHYAIGELHIEYADGSRVIIGTDESWLCKKSPITFANIYDGEVYDARIDISEIADEIIALEPNGCGALSDRYGLPIVKKEQFEPISVLQTPNGETVLDFGQNLTGWVEFDCKLGKDQSITLSASEILQQDSFYNGNLRTAKAQFVYISDGEQAHVRPHFTFYGFRYMKVECEAMALVSDFTAFHLRSDIDQIGEVQTGNDKVNRLFQNALWSQKDNFLDVPTDCPQRDERMGWTGDAQVFSQTACYNMHVPAFFRKYLWDMRAEQEALQGSVPNIVPRLKEGMVSEHGASPWADAAVIIPWTVYRHFGSETLLAETYSGMKAWVECQRQKAVENGLIQGGFHFADWLALDNDQPGPFGKTDPLYIANAYYYHCTHILAQAAHVLGMPEDAMRYDEAALRIKEAIKKAYFDENGCCICKTQTASALAIIFDLLPQSRMEEGNTLHKRVIDNHRHLNTGFVGTTMLCPALTLTGHHETAVDLLLNEDYPSWLYSVNLGATTIWERWNSVLADGSISSEGMNSLNHYSYGSIVGWMYSDVCGIRPESAGFAQARIEPKPDKRLGFAKGTIKSAAGSYTSSWRYEADGMVAYEVEVPFHAQAVIRLPKGRYQAATGMVEGDTDMKVSTGIYRFKEQENAVC